MRYTDCMSRFGLPLVLSAWLAAGSGLAAADPVLKVWVRLKDKGPSARPPAGFEPPALGRPARGPSAPGAAVPGTTVSGAAVRAVRAYEDRAVHEPYVAALEAEGFAGDTRIKWQNLVSGRIPASRLERLRGLPFVAEVAELPRKARRPDGRWTPWIPESLTSLRKPAASPGLAGADTLPNFGAFRALADSLNLLEVLDWMAASGMQPGKGMRVAVMDSDFDLGHAAFARLRNEGRVKDQYDFVRGRPQAVTSGFADSHGAQCLSLIGGYLPGTFVGGAYEADFLLYLTEIVEEESYVEEDYLAAAIERAVDSGAQVISTSVVYRTEFDSTPDIPLSQLDGRTRPSTLAALGAARRNVLVVSAMGNWDGKQDRASSLSVPSDADSILAVGMVNAAGNPCSYYTTGPTADGRIKPELVSMALSAGCGVVMPNPSTAQGLSAVSGTSFASPVVAAIAVLLRQAQPGKTAQEIRQSLLATARNASAPDNILGWGLPDAWAALGRPQVSVRRRPALVRSAPGTAGFDAAGRRLPAVPKAVGMRFRLPR